MSLTTDSLKLIADTFRKADKIPEYQQILDAMETIAELRMQLSESEDRRRSVQSELESVLADQKSAEGIRKHGDFYLLGNDYYCPGCWLLAKRLAPVVSVRQATGRLYSQCCRCKQEFAAIHGV